MARQTETHAQTVHSIFGQPAGQPAPSSKAPARRPSSPRRPRPLPSYEQTLATERRSRAASAQRAAARRQVSVERGDVARAQQRQATAHRRATVRRVAGAAPRAARPLRSNYQPVILAEFVAAILLTATTPIATRKDSTGLSPYKGQDMLQLAAITAVYLILALMSAGGRGPGRFAAWFGALILLTVGLGQAASIAKELDLFGFGGSPPAGTGQPAAAGGPAPKAA